MSTGAAVFVSPSSRALLDGPVTTELPKRWQRAQSHGPCTCGTPQLLLLLPPLILMLSLFKSFSPPGPRDGQCDSAVIVCLEMTECLGAQIPHWERSSSKSLTYNSMPVLALSFPKQGISNMAVSIGNELLSVIVL